MRMLVSCGLLTGMLMAPLAHAKPASSLPVRAVMVGGSSEVDACSTLMRVKRRSSKGERFVAVRSAPSIKSAVTERLVSLQHVMACEAIGEWTRVVFDDPIDGHDFVECGVSSPIAHRGPYDGECASGWVASHCLTVEAG